MNAEDRWAVAECEECGDVSAGFSAWVWAIAHLRLTRHAVFVVGKV